MTDAAPYIDAWLQREPEMRLALTFVPATGQGLLPLWGALLHQLYEATFDIAEPQVAHAKLCWWQLELERGRGAGASHPLARALFAHESVATIPVDRWRSLAGAAIERAGSEQTASDTGTLLASHRALADAIARIEAELFEGRPDAAGVQRNLVLWQMRGSRQPACWPLQLRARLQLDARASDPAVRAGFSAALARELPDRPRSPGAVLFRRLRSAADDWQLRRLRAQGTFLTRPSPRLAWNLWRAARAGA